METQMTGMQAEARYGNWTMTHGGRRFWPLDPRPEEIDIRDIAHALSHICRYGGHCNRFYSVAEHSILMARHASKENRLWALLHDATEAYLMDLPRPIKPFLPGYADAETALHKCIAKKFNLDTVIPDEVHDLDHSIIRDEMEQNMCYIPDSYVNVKPLGIRLEYWNPEQAKAAFMREYVKIESWRGEF